MSIHAPFSPDTLEFLSLLSKHQVRYLIVGGEAVIFYGHARLTGDIDLFYSVIGDNPDKVHGVLVEFWGGKIPGIKKVDELKEAGAIFQFGVPPNRIDLLSGLEEVDFEDSWQRKRIQNIVYGRKKFPVYYIGLEDLIANKRAVGRDRDKDDLAFLLKAHERIRQQTKAKKKTASNKKK